MTKALDTQQHSYEDLKAAALKSYQQEKLEDTFYITCAALRRPQAERTMRLLFAQTYPEKRIEAFNPHIKDAIWQALQESGVEYQRLGNAWENMLRLDTCFAPLFKFYDRKEALTDNEWAELEQNLLDPYFTEGLRKFIVTRIVFENIMVTLRKKTLLEWWPKGRLKTKHLSFTCAMAEQCYTNEYVYEISDEEKAALQDLPQDDPIAVSILACYEPLDQFSINPKISANAAFRKLAKLQILGPRERKEIMAAVPSIGMVDDDVSQKVRAMYEENPYPRWQYVNLPVSADAGFKPDILIAGCGTGKFMTSVGALFPNAQILGIDITKASLAYAAQKGKEYGLSNLNYIQCDILNVDKLGRDFDFINCSGVLHHMEDPMAGWKKLLSVLRPGGVMYISLYSTIARRLQKKVREYVQEAGYAPTPEGIRAFRKDALKKFGKETGVFTWHDFYTTSEVRDLFFHVQERSYTIPELRSALDELGLEFIHFRVNDVAKKEYKRLFPDDVSMKNLDNWEAVEKALPDTFASMYNFVCQRKGETLTPAARRIANMGF